VFSVSEKELLLKADGHPNIIRYHTMILFEFYYYIALELHLCSLREVFINNDGLTKLGIC
jgi:hypothetical protein